MIDVLFHQVFTVAIGHHSPGVLRVDPDPFRYIIPKTNEKTFRERAHDTPLLPTISYWRQHIHEI
jgi:hypothetical protein